jgi:hypothetical protein
VADSHQEEVDENAINEALEARLMELIAAAPQHNLEVPIMINMEAKLTVPANPDLFNMGFIMDFPLVQTSCQSAQPQMC